MGFLKGFEVLTAVASTPDDSRQSTASILVRKLKIRLEAAEGTDIPKNCANFGVSIHAIATFQAVNNNLAKIKSILGTLDTAVENSRANYYLIPEVDGPNDLRQDLIQSLKDLVKHDEKDQKGFENLKIQEIYCRHGQEASCLNHWKPILKGLVVKGENLNKNSANQAIGAINDQWSLTCV
ncbi:hypothetical protein BY996DRAFT_6415937 [Phakopsora pachyrhizi]|nr:hypothetical protein BY996DRAFT_6415937 [Phakopsora pachyrhizi]